ncbi:MAG: GatB/YqeY domain-containing protein [Candidatus Dormibacteraeota bacterium]|nr:GatB/YqeY domain-containing protein [Candidatus Dormibacteraeota bacterium]
MAESLIERIERDLVGARKGGDQLALSTLGLLKSEIVRATKAKQAGALDDRLVIRVVRSEVKRREEAAAGFRQGGRAESAQRELDEAQVLGAYLPPDLTDAEVEAEVRAAIEAVAPQGPRDFGAVMKAATARLGDGADGGRIAAVARRLLG